MSNSILAMPYFEPFGGIGTGSSNLPFNNNTDGHLSTMDPNSPYYIKPLEAMPYINPVFGGLINTGSSNLPFNNNTDGHLSTMDPNSPYYIKPLDADPFGADPFGGLGGIILYGDTARVFNGAGNIVASGASPELPVAVPQFNQPPTHKRHHHLLPILIIGGIAFMKFKS